MSITAQDFLFTPLFLEMQCDRNEGGTRNLVLRGNDLFKKIGRRVRDADVITIVEFLRGHPEVVVLDFPYNDITDCGFSTLVEFFLERPVVRHLNLVGNNIGPRGVGYLAAVGDKISLNSLRLTGNKIGPEGGKELSKLLYKTTGLRFLDLSDTHQTMSSLAYLMTGLMPSRGGTNILEYVDIGRPLPQEYHQVADAHAAEFLGQILGENKVLKELHVQQYQLDFRDMEILLEGLMVNRTLVCLDLNNNNIADDGVGYLCKYLDTSPPLECLMIGKNNFGNIGATSLGFSLPFSKVRLLDITDNHISEEGLLNLLYTIRKTVTMRALFMWGNRITHDCLVLLQRLFRSRLLDPEHTDVEFYCADGELKPAWNSRVNRYTQRFYCVSDYGHPPLRKILWTPYPPEKPPIISYKYHVDKAEVGFPMCEWQQFKPYSKYRDPY